MKVLVIGGCGFIGSHIVDRLLVSGHSIRVLDRKPELFRDPLPGVEYQFGDFNNRFDVIEALAGVDAVMHLASTTFPGTADLDPVADIQSNLVGTLHLLNAMVKQNTPRLLFLSSGGTVYGPPDMVPIPEAHPLRPINSYGIVKVAIENYLEMFRRTRGISNVAIRASNPYGPRQAHTGVQGVVSTFLAKLQRGERPEIWGDGSAVRDYLCVTDLAELCVLAIESDKQGAYNAGSGVGTSLTEIVEILDDVIGRPVDPIYKPARMIDVKKSVLDVSNAQSDFGWACKTPLREGIKSTYDWLCNIRPLK